MRSPSIWPLALLLAASAPFAAQRGFDARDLVALDRVSDPRLSPDGDTLVYSLRETDMDANKGVNGVWRLDLGRDGAAARRLTPPGESWSSARFGGDGQLYALSGKSGKSQVW